MDVCSQGRVRDVRDCRECASRLARSALVDLRDRDFAIWNAAMRTRPALWPPYNASQYPANTLAYQEQIRALPFGWVAFFGRLVDHLPKLAVSIEAPDPLLIRELTLPDANVAPLSDKD